MSDKLKIQQERIVGHETTGNGIECLSVPQHLGMNVEGTSEGGYLLQIEYATSEDAAWAARCLNRILKVQKHGF